MYCEEGKILIHLFDTLGENFQVFCDRFTNSITLLDASTNWLHALNSWRFLSHFLTFIDPLIDYIPNSSAESFHNCYASLSNYFYFVLDFGQNVGVQSIRALKSNYFLKFVLEWGQNEAPLDNFANLLKNHMKSPFLGHLFYFAEYCIFSTSMVDLRRRQGCAPAPGGPNSFISMHFSAKK